MGIFQFILIVVIIGVIVYLVRRYVPMDEAFKTVVLWAGIICCVLLLLYALGLLPFWHDVMIPRLR